MTLVYNYWFILSPSLTAGKRAQRDTVLTVEATCVTSWYTTRMPRRERAALVTQCLKLRENGNSQFQGPLFVIKPFLLPDVDVEKETWVLYFPTVKQ